MNPVIIRTDSSYDIGTGHVFRCLTLAQDLKRKGVAVTFASRQNPGNLLDLIRKYDFGVFELPAVTQTQLSKLRGYSRWLGKNEVEDARDLINIIREKYSRPPMLIVDHYGVGLRWEKTIRPYVANLMVIDDLANRKHDCQILLDQNYFLNMKSRYAKLVPASCRLFLGPQYSLLRNEFLEGSAAKKTWNKEKLNILVFLGGSDLANATPIVLKGLVKISAHIGRLDVVAGKLNRNFEMIRKYCRKFSNAHLYGHVDKMSELMNRADVSIGGGGVTTWERFAMGVPTFCVIQAENQKESVQALSNIGAVINLGWAHKLTPEGFAKKVVPIFSRTTILNAMKRKMDQVIHRSRLIENRNKLLRRILKVSSSSLTR